MDLCCVLPFDYMFFEFVGKGVCRDTFLAMHGISSGTLQTLIKHYMEVGVVPRDFMKKGRNHQSVTMEDSEFIIKFLTNIAAVHSLALPGRVPGMSL